MDLIFYSLILLSLGSYKMMSKKKQTGGIQIFAPGESFTEGTIQVAADIPIGNNLRLYREQGAYTLILQQFGLKR